MSKKQQVQINRMIEALEMISAMPVWQEGVSLESLNAQYEEARETARLAVEQFNRSEVEIDQALDAKVMLEAAHGMAHEGLSFRVPGMDLPRMVALTEAEYLKMMRESERSRNLACYILGRTEELKIATGYRSAVEAVREKCNEEVARG